jgi:hypothetical protein
MSNEKNIEIPNTKTMNNHKTGTHEEWPYNLAHDALNFAVSQRRSL